MEEDVLGDTYGILTWSGAEKWYKNDRTMRVQDHSILF